MFCYLCNFFSFFFFLFLVNSFFPDAHSLARLRIDGSLVGLSHLVYRTPNGAAESAGETRKSCQVKGDQPDQPDQPDQATKPANLGKPFAKQTGGLTERWREDQQGYGLNEPRNPRFLSQHANVTPENGTTVMV
jgi:hypothetical protein